MYWQVYLHKTVISAEFMLLKTLQRARELVQKGSNIFVPPNLNIFLTTEISIEDFSNNKNIIAAFTSLDDNDIMYALKQWIHCEDAVLKTLCNGILNRNLFKIQLTNDLISEEKTEKLKIKCSEKYGLDISDTHYLVISGSLSNSAYLPKEKNINILTKNGKVIDVAHATDLPNITAMSTPVNKSFVCWPKEINGDGI